MMMVLLETGVTMLLVMPVCVFVMAALEPR